MNRNLVSWLLGTLGVLAVAGAVWYYAAVIFPATSQSTNSGPRYGTARPVSSVLRAANQDYASAVMYQGQEKFDLALQFYQKALPEAQDNNQAAQIKYNIAYATEKLGNYADAIAQYKAIAADVANPAITRAYAVQEIGLMYYQYYGGDARPVILAETFKDSPYSSFKKDSNFNFAYINVFQYATTLYPVADSEARVAYGYSNELSNTLHGATTSPQGKQYVSLILQSIQAADADVLRMKQIPSEVGLIPDVLSREGITVGHLVALGAADSEQAETLFKAGLQYAATIGIKLGNFTAMHYAAFLASQFGKARSADIKNILDPFRAGNEAQIVPAVIDFYRASRTDPTLTVERSVLIVMGRTDSDFKNYLISLGWKATDF